MAKATRTAAGASSFRTKDGTTRRHTKKLSVEGVVLHIRAIIEQGRAQEFLDACKERGFTTMKGPPGLVAFTRNFIAAAPGGAEATAKGAGDKKFSTAVREMVATNAKMIDDCYC
ncbi:hypothetical protein EN904_33995 [Mesorhizobium sp. M7A.F.Ca.CA.001.07.2.1]|uniref:hypothetical protein n=1 Tax=Mesorhizobium TaxID=68287 RepID=UPI000FCBCE5C|nr:MULTISPECIES: hypothetical protein [Mesorhizobium]RVB20487.1 hypothetical protein EN918_31290 [Mesorhizobium sp. M7A.F.Ca.CA.004.05.1.1]MCF6122097.1 hypothetical protein [Mesorhizobium ciceri]MCQ8812678.1 hypothetical protein [Mesorhizobium sp. SEMIA396]RUX74708.1 hypothetical protein EN983_19180 [Mesorhizobium sp. M7A.F.Ca.CA.004.08.2.1]RUX87090.1 hypothetical protein EN982_12235 [Mesorhizobium sp. M7A.F.Ca.CA.004.08.1.1]